MRHKLFIGGFVMVLTLIGCSEMQRDQTATSTQPCCPSPEPTASRSAIVRSAAKLVGARTIEVHGRRIAYDCAGVTRAVFLEHGIDLYQSRSADEQANGVRLIYNHIK